MGFAVECCFLTDYIHWKKSVSAYHATEEHKNYQTEIKTTETIEKCSMKYKNCYDQNK